MWLIHSLQIYLLWDNRNCWMRMKICQFDVSLSQRRLTVKRALTCLTALFTNSFYLPARDLSAPSQSGSTSQSREWLPINSNNIIIYKSSQTIVFIKENMFSILEKVSILLMTWSLTLSANYDNRNKITSTSIMEKIYTMKQLL